MEGPEHVEQFAQVCAIHQAWFTAGVARTVDETGASVYFVGALEEGNFHIIASSPLFRQDAKIVNPEALAERAPEIAVSAHVGPPNHPKRSGVLRLRVLKARPFSWTH